MSTMEINHGEIRELTEEEIDMVSGGWDTQAAINGAYIGGVAGGSAERSLARLRVRQPQRGLWAVSSAERSPDSLPVDCPISPIRRLQIPSCKGLE